MSTYFALLVPRYHLLPVRAVLSTPGASRSAGALGASSPGGAGKAKQAASAVSRRGRYPDKVLATTLRRRERDQTIVTGMRYHTDEQASPQFTGRELIRAFP